MLAISKSIIFMLLVNLYIAQTHPVNETNYELTSDYFEGDMILKIDVEKGLNYKSETRRTRRHAIINRATRWPNRIVTYDISHEFSRRERDMIFGAMHHIMSQTCIRFHQRHGSSQNYVFIQPDSRGCSANVGYWGYGVTNVNLKRIDAQSLGCFTQGIIVHELLHTLGIFHQQSASDRDDYVRINYENIIPGQEHNFEKFSADYVTSFGVGYDYSSVMHYDTHSFSKNGRPTITPIRRVDQRMIGQRDGLSSMDVMKIRRMYDC